MKYTPMLNKDCFFTHMTNNLECHHIFGGSNRKHSEKYGLKVWLSQQYHNQPPMGVHHNAKNMQILHQYGQQVFEQTHTHKEFMDTFKRNYL